MSSIDYLRLLQLAAPETFLTLTGLMVLAVDLIVGRGSAPGTRIILSGSVAATGCLLAAGGLFLLPVYGTFAAGMLVADPLTVLIKVSLVILTLFTVLLAFSDAAPLADPGEYFALLLFACVGMMFLTSAEDLLMVFLALEFTSLSLYILAAFNKQSPHSTEAGIKYFLFGSISAAFMLFGLSLVYGVTGSVQLPEVAAGLARAGNDPLALVALVMIAMGFGFKVAAVPFHLWAPDVYQGAPIPSAALIASGSKVASFFVFAKVVVIGFGGAPAAVGSGAAPVWVILLGIMAAVSMILGNLAALVQVSVRRLLAFSAIAHAGYMLLGILAGTEGFGPLVYYVITYGLATVGAFGVVSIVQARTGSDRLCDFAGFHRRFPVLAFCMLIFMLSLAGIPPLAGFFGKFYVFAAAVKAGSLALFILALATSTVSLFYYLQVLKQIYVGETADASHWEPVPITVSVALLAMAFGVTLLGCFPDLLLNRITIALRITGF